MTFADGILDQLQAIAISFNAWRGSDATLAAFVAKALDAPERQTEIQRHLRSKPLQTALHARDVALWIGHDKLLRLVDQQPLGARAAGLRVAHHPGPNACRYCLLAEVQSLTPELEQELDAYGVFVPGSFVHPLCATAWGRLRSQAEQQK